MARVPVLRSGWKIDPAELAVAQERTEARLTDLFTHRPAPAGRRPGPHPPIIVDGVELIGDTEVPVDLVDDAVAPGVDLPADLSGVAGGDPGMGVVGVVDAPGTELVGIVLPPPSTGELVGVMDRPGRRARRPVQLTLSDGPADTAAIEVAPAPEPFVDEMIPFEPLVMEIAAAEPTTEAWDDELALVEPEPAPVSEAVPSELAMEPEPFEAVVASSEAFEDAVIVADPAVVIELPGSSTLAADVPALEMAIVETAEVDAVAVETPAPDLPAAPRPPAIAKPRPPRATKPPATRSKAAKPPSRPGGARSSTAARPATAARLATAAPPATAARAATAAPPATAASPAAPARPVTAAHPAAPARPATAARPAAPARPATAARPAAPAPPVTAAPPATAARPAAPAPPVTAAPPATAARPAAPAHPTALASPRPAASRSVPASAPAVAVVVAALCPYCALLLQPPPTSGRRCPRCRQQIVVKHVDGRTAYLTEAAIAIFEAERRKESDVERLSRERERWLKLAVAAGAPAQKASRLATARLSQEAVDEARQLYLATVDRTFGAAKRDHRWEDAARIRREQAIALHRLAGSPQPPPDDLLAIYQEGVAAELRGLGEIVRDAELVSAMCCDPCRADNGRVVAISKELAAPQLPHQGCPKVFCRCTWDLATRDRELVLRYLRRHPRHAARPAAKH